MRSYFLFFKLLLAFCVIVFLSYSLLEVQGKPSLQGTITPTATPMPFSLTGVSINDGAIDTTANLVQLRLAFETGTILEPSGFTVELSNDGVDWIQRHASRDSNGTPTALVDWRLSPGDGIKRVYVDSPYNLSDKVSDTINMDTSVGNINSISINEDALSTNNVSVTLTMEAQPLISQMQVSNGGGFVGAEWEPFALQKQWTITQLGNYVIPRTVYIRFKTYYGETPTYQDDIVLDLTQAEANTILLPLVGK